MNRFVRYVVAAVSMLWLATGASFADVYLVKGIAVDVTAENSIQARATAFDQARVIGANRLLQRITTAEDRANAKALYINSSIAARLVAAVDVQDEKQSATRYLGLLAVKFDERAVKAFLRVYDMPFVDSQASLALMVPEVDSGVNPDEWASVWENGSDANVLAPFVVSEAIYLNDVNWEDIASDAYNVSAQRGVVARVKQVGLNYFVSLYDLRQEYSSRMPLGTAGPFLTLEEAKAGSIGYLEDVWKTQNIVRVTGETSVSAVARYSSQQGWVSIQKALKNSRLIKNVLVEKVSVRGADVSFSYAGRPDQLAAELRTGGVILSSEQNGWSLEPVAY
ncbi:DUF2066 domain-containing protein [Hirschia baltica]|uniref:DUF2066 domain-containing protein n=1 Tax=Hirschia baltica (strain ATCC 49814 / DSM 5838 / IFAM 1418) TaxID=582402 RepID=C6XKN3_HIRBI|nr:DUF2066 domain-containing protein [Hirschia baltica]ACT59600.1 hypothetical protein Hbal_1915 [Hirschia baltica ATCC 49814]